MEHIAQEGDGVQNTAGAQGIYIKMCFKGANVNLLPDEIRGRDEV